MLEKKKYGTKTNFTLILLNFSQSKEFSFCKKYYYYIIIYLILIVFSKPAVVLVHDSN